MTENAVTARWRSGGVAVGGWCATGQPFVAEIVARQGFDFVLLDTQHGLYSPDALLHCLVAVEGRGPAPLVRVASGDPVEIGKVLDAGAHGVVVPMIETATDAERAVGACRYHPDGVRSFGPLRASLRLGRDPQALAGGVVCLVMVETSRGVDHVDEIAAVPGVDGVFVGPADLAISYGLPPSMTPVPGVHADALAEIRSACKRAGIPVGIPCADAAAARDRVAEGYTLVTLGSDAQWITEAARSQLQAFREGPPSPSRPDGV
jgi:4-hydroxy-2-oxoheptanedioate aldolase